MFTILYWIKLNILLNSKNYIFSVIKICAKSIKAKALNLRSCKEKISNLDVDLVHSFYYDNTSRLKKETSFIKMTI